MNSKILNTLGMSKVDPMIFVIVLLLFSIGLLVALIISNGKIKKLSEKYENFMQGKDMESMEDVINHRFEQIDKMLADTEKNVTDIQNIMENMKTTVQKTGIVKYDAFHEMGGKMSFALVMLDGNDSGFVINSMHNRDGCYTYIKEIIQGESYIPLGNEEREALNNALGIIGEN